MVKKTGRRALWRDPRFIAGLLLIAVAVALGSWAVGQAGGGTRMYRAVGDLPAGTALEASALEVVVAAPGTGPGVYLTAAELPKAAVLTRSVGAGELIPAAAVSRSQGVQRRSVVVPLETALPKRVQLGSEIDLWLVPEATVGEANAPQPRLLTTGAIVTDLPATTNQLAATGEGIRVEVTVPEDQVAAVLTGIADRGAIMGVPTWD